MSPARRRRAPATAGPARAAVVPSRRGRPPRISPEQIVGAATELFARYGYRDTTVASIARAVGVADTSVLHHFGSKRAILDAVVAADDGPATAEMLEMLRPGGLQALRNLSAWGARMEQNPISTRLLLVLSAEALGAASELHDAFRDRYEFIRSRVADALERGIDAGEIRPDVDVVHEATGLAAFLDGLRLQWFLDDGATSIDAHFRVYVDHLISRVALADSD